MLESRLSDKQSLVIERILVKIVSHQFMEKLKINGVTVENNTDEFTPTAGESIDNLLL